MVISLALVLSNRPTFVAKDAHACVSTSTRSSSTIPRRSASEGYSPTFAQALKLFIGDSIEPSREAFHRFDPQIQDVDNKVVILRNIGGAAQPSKLIFFGSLPGSLHRKWCGSWLSAVLTLQRSKNSEKVLDCYLVL